MESGLQKAVQLFKAQNALQKKAHRPFASGNREEAAMSSSAMAGKGRGYLGNDIASPASSNTGCRLRVQNCEHIVRQQSLHSSSKYEIAFTAY